MLRVYSKSWIGRVDLFKDSLALLLALGRANLLPIDAHFQIRCIFTSYHDMILIWYQTNSCPNLRNPSTQIVKRLFLTSDSTKIVSFYSIDFEFLEIFAPVLQPCHHCMLSSGDPSTYYYSKGASIVMDMDKASNAYVMFWNHIFCSMPLIVHCLHPDSSAAQVAILVKYDPEFALCSTLSLRLAFHLTIDSRRV